MSTGYKIDRAGIKRIRQTINRVNSMPIGSKGHGDFHRRKAGGVRGLEYEGYFKAINTSDTVAKIKIVDGGNEDNTFCGRVVVGSQTITIDVEEFTISEDGLIAIRVLWDDETSAYDAILIQLTEIPSIEGVVYIEICNYTYEYDEETEIGTIEITQVWTDGTVDTLNGSYWT